jgi:hypothetical protein
MPRVVPTQRAELILRHNRRLALVVVLSLSQFVGPTYLDLWELVFEAVY